MFERNTVLSALVGCSAIALVSGCGTDAATEGATPDEEAVGTLSAAISAVPSGIACVQLTLSGSVNSAQKFTVTSGTTPVVLNIGLVPIGNVSVAPRAYNIACASVTTTTVAAWSGPVVSTNVLPGVTTEIAVTLRQNLETKVTVDFVSAATNVFAGEAASYAVLRDGTLRAWGKNTGGELGNGTTTSSTKPVLVTGLTNIVSGSAGAVHACALNNSGKAFCWGRDDARQLGNGTGASSTTPVAVSSSLTFQSLVAGREYTCSVSSGANYCWGGSNYGQLGTGDTAFAEVPTQAIRLSGEFVAAGATSYTTFSFGGTSSFASGANLNGQMGIGSTSSGPITALTSTGFSGRFILAAAVSSAHACVAEAGSGNVYCAGHNSTGRLGNGTTTNSLIPVQATGINGVVALTAGENHTCALKSDGTVWCWGVNTSGEIADGTTTTRTVPTQIKGLAGITSIASGQSHTCAASADGIVYCWGLNSSGQLGDGTNYNRGVPTKVLL